MILVQLFFAFLRIGAFSFGGGYAMIPLIAAEVERYGWIDGKTFADVIAIAEMTPGPIAVNLATFVGFRSAGFAGSVVATFGVVLPSFVLIMVIGAWLRSLRNNPVKDAVFAGFRPAVIGLVVSAALVVGRSAFVLRPGTKAAAAASYPSLDLAGIPLDIPSIVIAAATLVALFRTRIHPGLILVGAGVAGALTGVVLPVFGR